jgi:hypothetical protein
MQASPFQVKKPLWLKLLVWLGVFVLIYVGVSYTLPFAHAYDVKTAIKTACVEYVRETRNKEYQEDAAKWPTNFTTALNRLGLDLTPDQYSFEIHDEVEVVVCTGKAAFVSYTEWPGSYLFTGKTRKFRTVHRPVSVYKWRRKF